MKTEKIKKVAKDGTAQALAIIAGILTGALLMKLAKDLSKGKVPGWAIPIFGLLGFGPHFLSDNAHVKAFGSALIAAGGLQALHLVPNDAAGNIAKIKAYVPNLIEQGVVVVTQPAPDTTVKGLGMPDNYARLVSGLGNYSSTMEQLVL
jgi:hypothetical protein